MELILKEWIGAGREYVLLLNDSIISLNVEHDLEQSDEIKKRHFSSLEGIKEKEKIQTIELTDYEPTLKKNYKNDLQNIISKGNYRDKIIFETNKINQNHKAKFKKENINPICEFIEIKEEMYVRTYQYAAEFEIKFGDKKTDILKVKIEPRDLINKSNFKKMFEVVFNFHRLDNISGGQSASFLLLYYLAFIGRLTEVLKKGVYREYVELEENLPYLKERLIVQEHIRLNRFNKHKIYCGYSELTPNNLINQIIKATLTIIQNHFKEYRAAQHEVRKIKTGLFQEEVSDLQVKINAIKSIRYNRQNKPYEEIMAYCENILRNIGGSFSSENKLNYSAFYIDMNELFETFVGKKLKEIKTYSGDRADTLIQSFDNIWGKVDDNKANWPNYSVEFQNQRTYALDENNVFTIKPDFLIKNSLDEVIAVADTKYKRLSNNEYENYGISSSDVYQVLSYAHKFNAKIILLIYPQPLDKFKENLSFTIKVDNEENSEKTLHICFVNLIFPMND